MSKFSESLGKVVLLHVTANVLCDVQVFNRSIVKVGYGVCHLGQEVNGVWTSMGRAFIGRWANLMKVPVFCYTFQLPLEAEA